jgi:hypothetical protein
VVQSSPKCELVYLDESGSTAALTFSFPIDTLTATALSAAEALGAVVASLTGCVLVRLRIKYSFTRDDFASPDVGASVVRRGVFIFDCGTDTPQALIEIPGLRAEFYVTGGTGDGIVIDTENGTVIDFVTAIETGNYTNPFADDILTLSAAYRQSRV